MTDDVSVSHERTPPLPAVGQQRYAGEKLHDTIGLILDEAVNYNDVIHMLKCQFVT